MFSVLRPASRFRVSLSRGVAAPAGIHRPTSQIRTLITKRYTTEHETVSYDDQTGLGTITITEHAQSSLGDVVFVELPALGTQVAQGDQIGAVESVKAASDIYAPVSGTIKEVNENLNNQPGLLNKSPEEDGWLCKIQLSEPQEVDDLLTAKEYLDIQES